MAIANDMTLLPARSQPITLFEITCELMIHDLQQGNSGCASFPPNINPDSSEKCLCAGGPCWAIWNKHDKHSTHPQHMPCAEQHTIR